MNHTIPENSMVQSCPVRRHSFVFMSCGLLELHWGWSWRIRRRRRWWIWRILSYVVLPPEHLSVTTRIHHILCKVNLFLALLLLPLVLLCKHIPQIYQIKDQRIIHKNQHAGNTKTYAYQKRYKVVEFETNTGWFDRRRTGCWAKIFEDEERGGLQCLRRPWPWPRPHLVSSTWKTWCKSQRRNSTPKI